MLNITGDDMLPFNNFKDQNKECKNEIINAVNNVIERGWYILGRELEKFERRFADFTGAKHCIGVASGTDAITISLLSLGIAQGDEIITTNLTAFPTITGIMRAGALPVTVDIKPHDALIDPDEIEKAITKKTRAIVPVHLYGQSCDMDRISEIAEKYGLYIVEDCAQSTGTTYKNKHTGTLGDAGAFSFYPTKNLGAFGDGGAIITDQDQIAQNARMIRNYGQSDRYHHDLFGINSRLDEIQAAILNVKLNYLDLSLKNRRDIAAYYRKHMSSSLLLHEHEYGEHSYHLFIIKHNKRDLLQKHLHKRQIQTLIHYPIPVSKQRSFPENGRKEDMPRSDSLCGNILSLPLYPDLKIEDIDKIISAVGDFHE